MPPAPPGDTASRAKPVFKPVPVPDAAPIRIRRISAPRPVQEAFDALPGLWADTHGNRFMISTGQSEDHLDVLLTAKDGRSLMFSNAIGFYATGRVRMPEVALFHSQATYLLRPALSSSELPRHVPIPGHIHWVADSFSPDCVAHSLVWHRVNPSAQV